MRQQRKQAFATILTPLVSAVIGWALFVAALLLDITVDTTLPSDALFGPEAAQVVRPSRYLFFAAIAVLALGTLWARRRLEQSATLQTPESVLVKPAHEFTGTVVIIGLVVAAWAAIAVFLDSFMNAGSIDIPVGVRLWNTYLPIILYTALVVTVLLAAFVFGKHRVASSPALRQAETVDVPEEQVQAAAQQRFIALAFALPIVAVAAALIFGMIVFDATQTALQVWIWVIIQLIIATGIVFGTRFARRGFDEVNRSSGSVTGAVVGAKNLNFVLSVVFAAVVAFMSLGYGASATEQLRIAPSLTVSVFENEPKAPTQAGDSFNVAETRLTVNGSDLQRLSPVTLMLTPGGGDIVSGQADRDGFAWLEENFPRDLAAGTYTLEATASAADGSEIQRTVPVVLSEDGMLSLPEGDASSDPANWEPRLMSITPSWLVSDLLPAFLLLALAASSIALTLIIRNRDRLPAGNKQSAE